MGLVGQVGMEDKAWVEEPVVQEELEEQEEAQEERCFCNRHPHHT